MQTLRAGNTGEHEAEYLIEFHYGNSQNRVTLHVPS